MQNLELKARLPDREAAVRRAFALGARDGGALEQTDTYFRVPRGRLKVRQQSDAAAGQLMAYARPDLSEARLCEYSLIDLADAAAIVAALRDTIGVRAVVRKSRRLFFWKNVRIHLDRVEQLGDFLEFEAVLEGECDIDEARRDLDALARHFGVRNEDILPGSYVDMLDS